MTDGCGATIASGSMVTKLAKGKSAGEAQKISQQDVLNALGGLPEGSRQSKMKTIGAVLTLFVDGIAGYLYLFGAKDSRINNFRM